MRIWPPCVWPESCRSTSTAAASKKKSGWWLSSTAVSPGRRPVSAAARSGVPSVRSSTPHSHRLPPPCSMRTPRFSSTWTPWRSRNARHSPMSGPKKWSWLPGTANTPSRGRSVRSAGSNSRISRSRVLIRSPPSSTRSGCAAITLRSNSSHRSSAVQKLPACTSLTNARRSPSSPGTPARSGSSSSVSSSGADPTMQPVQRRQAVEQPVAGGDHGGGARRSTVRRPDSGPRGGGACLAGPSLRPSLSRPRCAGPRRPAAC
jgi:hypothetical protein